MKRSIKLQLFLFSIVIVRLHSIQRWAESDKAAKEAIFLSFLDLFDPSINDGT
jgi:hypothetical protein